MKRVFAVLTTVLAVTACRDVVEPGTGGGPLFQPSAPSSSSWTPIASMATERYAGMAANGANGHVYVFGGLNFVTSQPGAEAYDPSANTWSPIADPGVLYLAGVARGGDGRIYLAGGANSSGIGISDVRAYDPGSDTYATVASMSVGRYAPAAATGADGKVYVVGGIDASLSHMTSAEVYDPTTDTWSPIASTAVGHYGAAAATGPDGRIYVFGGYDEHFAALSAVEAYDPTTNTWSSVAPMPGWRVEEVAVAGADGHIYVFGGIALGGISAAALAYEPATDTWTTVASMSVARELLAGAGGLDGRVYAIGGYDGTDVLSSVEALQTSITTTTTLTSDLNPSVFGQAVHFTATVTGATGGDVSGTVKWFNDGVALGSSTLVLGHASIAVSDLSVGTHEITATYVGEGSFETSTSPSLTQTVNAPPNSAPVADADGPYAGNEGSRIAFSAAGSSDPDGDPLTYDWDFGDGATLSNGGATPSHTYADNGSFTATVTVHDDHGHATSASASVRIANVAPTVSAIANATFFQGGTYSAAGSFTDPGADTYTGSVAWGDGSSESLVLSGNTFRLSHTYSAAGTFTVTVSITDDDRGTGTSSATVRVLSPADGVQALADKVQSLLIHGTISSRQFTALMASVNAAAASLANGNTNAASGQLGAFINKVQAAINSGRISAAAGADLIALAQQVLHSIGG